MSPNRAKAAKLSWIHQTGLQGNRAAFKRFSLFSGLGPAGAGIDVFSVLWVGAAGGI